MIKVQRLHDSPEPEDLSDKNSAHDSPKQVRNPKHMVEPGNESIKKKALRKKRSHDSPHIEAHQKIQISDFKITGQPCNPASILDKEPGGGETPIADGSPSKIDKNKIIFTANGRRIYRSPPHRGEFKNQAQLIDKLIIDPKPTPLLNPVSNKGSNLVAQYRRKFSPPTSSTAAAPSFLSM